MIKLFRSFKYALNGILELIKYELNFRIHLVCFASVVLLGFYVKITSGEWLIILLTSAMVIALEAMNTAVEKLCDLYSKDHNPKIKVIKDIGAAAVFVAAIIAILIGACIFWKYLV